LANNALRAGTRLANELPVSRPAYGFGSRISTLNFIHSIFPFRNSVSSTWEIRESVIQRRPFPAGELSSFASA
jgi:hypothetical protein